MWKAWVEAKHGVKHDSFPPGWKKLARKKVPLSGNLEAVEDGVSRELNNKTKRLKTGASFMWLEANFRKGPPADASDEDVQMFARAYTLHILGGHGIHGRYWRLHLSRYDDLWD
jgi:hypothetical protein